MSADTAPPSRHQTIAARPVPSAEQARHRAAGRPWRVVRFLPASLRLRAEPPCPPSAPAKGPNGRALRGAGACAHGTRPSHPDGTRTQSPRRDAGPERPAAGPPWILMYHSVADPAHDPYGITVAPDRLDLQLRWLAARGLTGVSVATLLRARAEGRGRGLVGLTFDDGYADFAAAALPVLRRHGCTATLFVLPGRLGGDNAWDPDGPRRPLVDEADIRTAAAAGTEIASHGLYHVDLTRLDGQALRDETTRSRAWLSELTGRAPEGFCYPYGTVDGRVAAAVRAAGYAYGCAIRPPAGLGGPYALARTHISQADRSARLWAKRIGHRTGLR